MRPESILIGAVKDVHPSKDVKTWEIGFTSIGTGRQVNTETVREISERRARERFRNKNRNSRIIYAILIPVEN